MAITRVKKEEVVTEGAEDLKESNIVLFTDFKGVKVNELEELRQKLKGVDAKYKVIKKRLLGVILKQEGFDMDPVALEGQVGAVFGKSDISEVAGPLYQFSKDHDTFEILGAIDIVKKEEIPRETVVAIGQLPPRDTLIASVVGSIAAPIRGLLYVLSEKSKQS